MEEEEDGWVLEEEGRVGAGDDDDGGVLDEGVWCCVATWDGRW